MDTTSIEGQTATVDPPVPRPTPGRIVTVTYPDGRSFPAIVVRDDVTAVCLTVFSDSGPHVYFAGNDEWAWPTASHTDATTAEAYSGTTATDPGPTS